MIVQPPNWGKKTKARYKAMVASFKNMLAIEDGEVASEVGSPPFQGSDGTSDPSDREDDFTYLTHEEAGSRDSQ